MKQVFLTLLVFFLAGISPAQTAADIAYLNSDLLPATVLLYSQSTMGTYKMRCTATAIDKDGDNYLFLSAAHCACVTNLERESVSPEKTDFYISPDEVGVKTFTKADVIACGYQPIGDDFLLFSVHSAKPFPVISLGQDPQAPDPVMNVSSPFGMGKQVFLGNISSASLERNFLVEDSQWKNSILFELYGGNRGSSGSALFCQTQHAICGVFVGTAGGTTQVAMPVSRLRRMMGAYALHGYGYWHATPVEPDEEPNPFTTQPELPLKPILPYNWKIFSTGFGAACGAFCISILLWLIFKKAVTWTQSRMQQEPQS